MYQVPTSPVSPRACVVCVWETAQDRTSVRREKTCMMDTTVPLGTKTCNIPNAPTSSGPHVSFYSHISNFLFDDILIVTENCSGRQYIWSPSHSNRFPSILVCDGPITTVYLIWGRYDTMTGGGASRSIFDKSHVFLL